MASKVYDVITDKIIGLLEQGVIPWKKPWNANVGHPRNLITGHHYRGVNVFLLSSAGYASPYWLTLKQVKAKKGRVKDGEFLNWTPVVFWNWVDKDVTDEETGEAKKRKFPILRYYRVYNSEQCEGVKVPDFGQPIENDFDPNEAADEIIANMPQKPEIQHFGVKACYFPSMDKVQLPKPELFVSSEEYYCAAFHELVHSTGHKSRMNRPGITDVVSFGTEVYSKEELVAEMGAAYLCGASGFVEMTLENSAAYIQGWLKQLKKDSTLIVLAAAQAQKAADFILGNKFEKESKDEQK